MPNQVKIYLDLSNTTLEQNLRNAIGDNWHTNFTFESPTTLSPFLVDIAVIDNQRALCHINNDAKVIYAGTVNAVKKRIFSSCNPEVNELQDEIFRAKDYIEICSLNREALINNSQFNEVVEKCLQPLSYRIRIIAQQLELRESLIDQLPVGVIGIDDTNLVVLVNLCAKRILTRDNMPALGAPIDMLYSGKIASFIQKNEDEMNIHPLLSIRKSPFNFKRVFAGHIVILWDQTN